MQLISRDKQIILSVCVCLCLRNVNVGGFMGVFVRARVFLSTVIGGYTSQSDTSKLNKEKDGQTK